MQANELGCIVEILWVSDRALRAGGVVGLGLASSRVDVRVMNVTAPASASGNGAERWGGLRNGELGYAMLCPLDVPSPSAPFIGCRLISDNKCFLFDESGHVAGIAYGRGGGNPYPERILQNSGAHSKGTIVWLTGLSGAGKTTIAKGVYGRLVAQGGVAVALDGDTLRGGLCRDLGFSDEDRKENIRRVGNAAINVGELGAVAVVSLISPFLEERAKLSEIARAKGIRFVEVYVNAPIRICESRDTKGLYKKVRQRQLTNFTGVDSSYEPPVTPALEVRTDLESVSASVERVIRAIESVACLTVAPSP